MNTRTIVISASAFVAIAASAYGVSTFTACCAPPRQPELAVAKPVDEPAKLKAPDVTVVAKPIENAKTPSFDMVRVEPSGDAVIAGRAEPGAKVELKLNEKPVGEVTASADGSFAIVLEKPLPQGTGQLTLETTVDGKVKTSDQSVAVAVTGAEPLVATLEADKPAKVQRSLVAKSPSAEVKLGSVDYDEAGNIQFQGSAKPLANVRFYVDTKLVGEVKADAAGQWLFKSVVPIAPGQHTLRADEVNKMGAVVSRAEVPFLREEPAKVVASQTPLIGKEPQLEKVAEVVSSAPPAFPPAAPSRIVIQPGQSLWRVSREVYGRGKFFTVIYEANKDQIKDPAKIYPGQIFSAPVNQQ